MKSRYSLELAQPRTRAKFAPQRRGGRRLDVDPEVVRQLVQVGYRAREIAAYTGAIREPFCADWSPLKAERDCAAQGGWLDENRGSTWLQQQRSDDLLALLEETDPDDILTWLAEAEEQNS